MKKILLTAVLFAFAVNVNAQDEISQSTDSLAVMQEEINQLKSEYADLKANADYNEQQNEIAKIWKRNKFFRIGYAGTASSFKGYTWDNKGGVFFNFGTSFLYPKQPVANCLKFGFDVIWFDMTYGTLKSNDSVYDWGDYDDYRSSRAYYDDDYDYDDDEGTGFTLKPTFLTMTMGIGPNITATPFYMMDNALRELKVRLYGHYRPGVTAFLVSENDEMEAAWAYTGWWDFGINFSWKLIGIGVEGSWGSGNFKSLVSEFDEEMGDSRSGKRSFSSCRAYISLNF